MSDHLSIRQYIFNSLNKFPWASARQVEVVWAYVDHLIAGRGCGRQALLRAGMSSLTDRQIQYQLFQARRYLEIMFQQTNAQIPKLDRRRVYHLAFDDTIEERVGKKVFAAAYQYDHCQNSVIWGQVLVDRVGIGNQLMSVAFQPYLPKSYLTRTNHPQSLFQTKIQIVKKQFQHDWTNLLAQGLRRSRIWVTNDSWYACRDLTTTFRQAEVNFLQGLKKDARCYWFGRNARLDEIFKPAAKWRYVTDPRTGKKVHYQEKRLNLTCHGRCKVFAVRRGADRRIRYYATNRLKIRMQRLLPRLKAHWRVEQMHHDLKQYFNLRGCYTGSPILNQVHWTLCYTVYLLFCRYQDQKGNVDPRPTIPQLIYWYQYDYDSKRARKCFISPRAREKLKKQIRGGNC